MTGCRAAETRSHSADGNVFVDYSFFMFGHHDPCCDSRGRHRRADGPKASISTCYRLFQQPKFVFPHVADDARKPPAVIITSR